MTTNQFKRMLEIVEKAEGDLLPDSVDGIILDSDPNVYKDYHYDVMLKAILSCKDDIAVIPILEEMGCTGLSGWACED